MNETKETEFLRSCHLGGLFCTLFTFIQLFSLLDFENNGNIR